MLRSRLIAVCSLTRQGALHTSRCPLTNAPSNGSGLRDAKQMHFGVDPQKLDLGLDLDNMDFTAIMNETRMALAKEKQGSANFQAEIDTLNAALQRAEQTPAHRHATGGGQRSIRGIAQAGAVHDANTPQAAYEQARRERAQSQAPRYTLVDTLRDCSANSSWSKAYEVFESAVAKSCQQAQGDATSDAPAPGSDEERTALARLQKVNATLPTTGGFRARKNVYGVMRWNSNHVYWLLKTLFDADRIPEAQRVWFVLTSIGFVEYHLDARTLNGVISMVRQCAERHRTDAQDPATLVEPLLASHPKTTAQLDDEKTFLRDVTITLETLAAAKHMPLGYKNQKTAQRARIADAIRRDQRQSDGEDVPSSSPAVPLQVGDFSSLLRVSQSEESTDRVLAMMEKLSMPRTSETYAALVVALHNPAYRLKDVSADEIAPAPTRVHSSKHTPRRPVPGTSEGGEGAAPSTVAVEDALDEDPDDAKHDSEMAKQKYEAYKEKRIVAARKWFHACPESERHADLFNAMLYLLRSRAHEDSFDALLLEFRGAPIRTADEARAAAEATASSTSIPPIQAPHWRTPPSGKTFELLVQRARYQHDWAAMWDLYEEMRALNVRGTRKLYQALLVEARLHQPAKILRRTHMDVSAFVMQLYENMKTDQIDVRSLGSTLSLVNAWSATRSQRRWD